MVEPMEIDKEIGEFLQREREIYEEKTLSSRLERKKSRK